MNSEIKIQFRNVVEQIFSNWSGLQLAVEHSMAGPNSRQTALQIVDHLTEYCFSVPDVSAEDLIDELEDVLDEEFNTICEDNSPNDVCKVIWQFFQCLKQGNYEQFQTEVNNLPPVKNWLKQELPVRAPRNDTESSSEGEQEMDVDPGWTVVKGKKKK